MKKEIVTKGVKGFNKDLVCNSFQYKEGETFEMKEKPIRCKKGFHFCENPLDVFRYYSPSESKYHEVEGIGETSTDNEDSKVAVSKIKIGIEIGLHQLIEKGIKFIFERTKLTKEKTNTEPKLQASNSGDSGAALTIGNYSNSETLIANSFACALGYQNKARGSVGSWLILSEWYEYENKIKSVKTVKVDGKKIKADIFYILKNGTFTIEK